LSRLIVRRNGLLTVAEGIHHQFGTRLNLFQCYVIELAIVLDTLHSPDDFAYRPTSRCFLRRLSCWEYWHLYRRSDTVELHRENHSSNYVQFI